MNRPKVRLQPCFLVPKTIRSEYPLFIYLPGMDGSGQLLRTQTDGLEATFDVRCLAIPRDDLTSWDELTNSVLKLIYAELKTTQRSVYLCGESFGGCLAQKVAIAAPHLFKRIILLNPASSFRIRPFFYWGSQFTDLVPNFFYDVGALGLLPFLASLPRMSSSDRQELLKAMRSVPPETIRWRISLLREFYIDEYKLSQLTQPILLIAGANDRLLPSQTEALRLANVFPSSKIIILPESGHACLLEKDINLYEIMRENKFLECSSEIKHRA
ncbi:alpha/beta hydrolase [Rivularia sp. UHCC 0363]|uniref:alpha/beta fold hydrolase n=1 Tax=Rivularia sp. UHCC 0363 TaxID=3110244 RepID=UPI002B1EB976|nr:alpha/beta hydrolase [Rivularia sp. UHCC 0363]MEA5595807.1 alpha/beta hydrolase [Rivularia sp. UHCC 0363]